MPPTARDTPDPGKTAGNRSVQPSRSAHPPCSPWRDPGTIRGSIVVGVASGLILLAGGNVTEHIDIDINKCSATAIVYGATITTTWRDDC